MQSNNWVDKTISHPDEKMKQYNGNYQSYIHNNLITVNDIDKLQTKGGTK